MFANEKDRVTELIKLKTHQSEISQRYSIVSDTSDWMRILRGDVIKLGEEYFLVRGNMRESRFGIDEQPKMWVFSATSLQDGTEKIIKTVFMEEFYAHIGFLRIRCYRDPDKESAVIDFGRGDTRFMQGNTYYDDMGNNVRVIDYIQGTTFFNLIPSINKQHKEYFIEDLPGILLKLRESIEAIGLLHKNGLCHGDIRNDHLYLETASGNLIWIDFDLKQDVSDFDLWSLGNIISYAAGKGIVTFDSVLKSKVVPDFIKNTLVNSDGSAFYNYRIMNLQKIFPYLPDRLSGLLRNFTIQPPVFYRNIDEFIGDYNEMLAKDFGL